MIPAALPAIPTFTAEGWEKTARGATRQKSGSRKFDSTTLERHFVWRRPISVWNARAVIRTSGGLGSVLQIARTATAIAISRRWEPIANDATTPAHGVLAPSITNEHGIHSAVGTIASLVRSAMRANASRAWRLTVATIVMRTTPIGGNSNRTAPTAMPWKGSRDGRAITRTRPTRLPANTFRWTVRVA